MVTKERTLWVDSCRFFAIFVIMCTHFLAEYQPQALLLWEEGLSSWLLYGLTGKFSVAFFFVLLGYYASGRASFSPWAFAVYSLRRYIQFAFYIGLCTLIYIAACYGCAWLFHMPGGHTVQVLSDGFRYNIIYLLRDSLLFEDNYNATLWCMQQLFIASLVCRALGYLPRRMGPAAAVFVMAVMLIIDASYCVWICAAVLGYVLRLVLESEKLCRSLNRPLVLIAMGLAALLLIKIRMAECVLQYAMQSAAALLLILLHFKLPALQRILSSKPLPWLGGISMGLFVVHTPINNVLMSSVYPMLGSILPRALVLIVCFMLSTALSIVCAWILHRLYSLMTKRKVPVKA